MTSHWVNNVVVGQLFLPAVQLMGVASVYGFFATVCFCGAVFASLYVVETKGRSLEEIEAVMNCGRRVSA